MEGLAETLQPEAAFTWDNQGFYRQLRDFNQWILEFNWFYAKIKAAHEERNVMMIIKPRKYGMSSSLTIPFQAAPTLALLLTVNAVLNALIPSMQTLATADFLDTALDILKNGGTGRIWGPLLALTALVAYGWLSGMLAQFAQVRLKLRLAETYRAAVTEKRCRLEYRYVEDNDSWELTDRVARDAEERAYTAFDMLLQAAGMAINVGSILLILATQAWWTALVILAFSVPLFAVALRSGRQNYEAFKDANRYTRRADYLSDVLSSRENVEERNLFGYSGDVNRRWYEKYETARKINLKAQGRNFIKMKSSSILTVVISLLIAVVLLFPLGNGAITIGMFMGLINALFGLVQNMSWQLSWVTQELAKAREYWKDLTAFAAMEDAPGAVELPAAEPLRVKRIELKNVRFCYPGTETMILDGVSMVLEEGGHYAFVGANGAGKTTITKLLTGLYPEYEGEILVNGKNLREYTPAQCKAMFAEVYQDFARYFVSVRENVELGNVNGVSEQAIEKALEDIELWEETKALPRGLETDLGKIRSDGSDLSGGQWQRLSIARALVSPAPVRILDEPTAALDPMAESKIYGLFGRASKGHLTVFITHRLGAARLADKIFVLDQGKIAEEGSHEELLAAGGIYAGMFEAQRSWYC